MRIISAVFLSFVLAACADSDPSQIFDDPQEGFEYLHGEYTIVSIRQNSFVSAPLRTKLEEGALPLGQTVSIMTDAITFPDRTCNNWTARAVDPPIDYASDPMLEDLRLAPTDSPLSSGDKRKGTTIIIDCDDKQFATIYQADTRVLATDWDNSAAYLVLERPLSTEQLRRLQSELTSLKFFSGELTGVLDEATQAAVRTWYEYRSGDNDKPIPLRPAITENLLDTMKVLGEQN